MRPLITIVAGVILIGLAISGLMAFIEMVVLPILDKSNSFYKWWRQSVITDDDLEPF